MTPTSIRRSGIALLTLSCTAAFAQAEPIIGRDIDANRFIVGHPASPTWTRPHSLGEHPAVLVAARAKHPGSMIDANTFTVLPPASVRWLASGEPETLQLANALSRTERR